MVGGGAGGGGVGVGLCERAHAAEHALAASAQAAFIELILLDDHGADLADLEGAGEDEGGDAALRGVVGVELAVSDNGALTADLVAPAKEAGFDARRSMIEAAEEAGFPLDRHFFFFL